MELQKEKLDFLVIGAQKCATSWMYYCLRDHPGLALPDRKAEVEYLGGDLYEERGADWYFSLVDAESTGKKGDVSVEYLFDERAAPVVAQLLPSVRVVAVLRNPIDRMLSAYFWYVRKARIPDLPLAVGARNALAAYNAGDQSAYADLVTRGFYDVQLERYLSRFAPAQVMVMLYDEIQEAPQKAISGVYEFLGVDPAFVPPSLGAKPKHNTYLKPLLALERLAPRSRAVGKAMDLGSQFARRIGLGHKRPDIDAATREELTAIFRPSVARAAEMVAALPHPQAARRAQVMRGWL
jgi:hypothetical protein